MATGTLEVHLRSARNLKDVQWIGKQDPYVKLFCGQTTILSKTHEDGGRNPEWNQMFTFPNVNPASTLTLQIMNKNTTFCDNEIGSCSLAIQKIMKQADMTFNSELEVLTTRNKACGVLCMSAKYVPNLLPTTSSSSLSLRDSARRSPSPSPPLPKGRWILPSYANTDCWQQYTPGKILGKGSMGVTYLATHKTTGERVAVKTIAKCNLRTSDQVADVQREVQVLHHLAGHPNVVTLKGVYEDRRNVCLVLDLCEGGELLEAMQKKSHYTERDAAHIIRTVLSVVAHCHSMGVVHRDLKPDNFLLTDSTKDAVIKATDFGLSVFLKEGEELHDRIGTPHYMAPEVTEADDKHGYGKEADVWSCGVILYILLCGFFPFHGSTPRQIFRAIRKDKIDFNSDPWPSISDGAKDCVKRMLDRSPRKRPTAADMLQHEWLTAHASSTSSSSDGPQLEVLHRLKKFAGMQALQKEAMKVIASCLPAEEINGLRSMFHDLDKDGNGTITVNELRNGLTRQKMLMDEPEVAKVLTDADVNGDGMIDYEEFLAAMLNQMKIEDDNRLMDTFNEFDLDGNGRISKDELIHGLRIGQAGCKTTMRELESILEEVDVDGNGEIDFMEFRTMMLSLRQ